MSCGISTTPIQLTTLTDYSVSPPSTLVAWKGTRIGAIKSFSFVQQGNSSPIITIVLAKNVYHDIAVDHAISEMQASGILIGFENG